MSQVQPKHSDQLFSHSRYYRRLLLHTIAFIFLSCFITQAAHAAIDFAACVAQANSITGVQAQDPNSLNQEPDNCTRYSSQVRSMSGTNLTELSYDSDGDGKGDEFMIIGQIFGATVCTVELMTVQVFSQMWCAIADYAEEPLAAAMMLYVVLFGIMFTVGMVQPTLKEVGLRAIKMVLVWAFAVNIDYAMGLGFQFYMTALKEGVEIIIGAISGGANDVTGVIYRIDELMQHVFVFSQEDMLGRIITGFSGFGTVYSNIPGGNFIGGALVAQGFMIFFVFARTIITYLIAIVGIAFYLTLAPIFVSFALFQATQSFFQRWLSQVSSFVVQPIILWAYIVVMERFITSLFDPDNLPDVMINLLGAMGYPEDNAQCWVTADDTKMAYEGSLTELLNDDSHSVGDFMGILGGRDLSTIGNHELEFSIGENINCTIIQEDYATPPSSVNDAYTDLITMFDDLLGPIGALILINYATVVFLDLVPELARQLSSSTGRALKIGGNWNQATNSSAMGGTLNVMGEQSIDQITRSTSSLTDQQRADINEDPTKAIPLILGGQWNANTGSYQGGILGGFYNDARNAMGWRG